jgi:hypothetical protein
MYENELMKVASACEDYGYELALLKIAEMEEKAKEEAEEEKKEENGESPALSEEEKKEAAAMGLYSFEGFINKLAHAGNVMYGDPSVYIRELALQNGSYEKVAKAADFAKKTWEAIAPRGGRAVARSSNLMAGGVGSGAGALLGAGTGALSSDDTGTGALIGGLSGAAAGGLAGIGARYGARALAHNAGKMQRAANQAKRVHPAATRDVVTPTSPEQLRAQEIQLSQIPANHQGDRGIAEFRAMGKGGSSQSTMIDALIRSRDTGILSQF